MKRPSDSGLFVVLEGVDGAGKSTQARWLADRLRSAGVPLVVSREPTDGPHGRRLRESATLGRLAPADELAAFLVDRREHVAQLILPGLSQGKVVLLDRYYFSTAAYQGARGFDWREIIRENEVFAPEPDLLLWFELPPEVSQNRIGARGDHANAFEQLDALRAVAGIYAQLASGRSYVRAVDARLSPEEVREKVWLEVVAAAAQKGMGIQRPD